MCLSVAVLSSLSETMYLLFTSEVLEYGSRHTAVIDSLVAVKLVCVNQFFTRQANGLLLQLLPLMKLSDKFVTHKPLFYTVSQKTSMEPSCDNSTNVNKCYF